MPIEVILPKVDMDMAAGTISRWLVKDGDRVKKGATIFEIETDKSTMEVEAPGDGTIGQISAREGAVVPVGVAVAFIFGEGEDASALRLPTAAPAKAVEAPKVQIPASEIAPISTGDSLKPRATPLARRIAREHGLDLAAIIGQGPRGRIRADDVQGHLDKPQPTPVEKPAAPSENHDLVPRSGNYDLVPIDAMRRVIAERLTFSKTTVPHFYLSAACDMEKLLKLRAEINAVETLPKLSVNDFIVKALALALKQVPEANASWSDEGIRRYRAVDVSVAVAVEGGLFTPVLRAADSKTLGQIGAEVKELATRAKERKLQPADYAGGSTTLSNLGMYGIESFAAIINPPQATILAVGAATRRPVVVGEEIRVGTRMDCTLSCDHRVVDGALGAQLLAAFRALIEQPLRLLV
jgi:pyruvate dehydrogenase E2 component (dihydrolipoamide acetyltransferase)